MEKMKHGDFTKLAQYYTYRPGYSLEVLNMLKNYVESRIDTPVFVADIGAGTGKLTENLVELGIYGVAIEPNEAMRKEGERNTALKKQFTWFSGSAENTGMENNRFDWILMGSSFHWTDKAVALKEFSRILKKTGFFTAVWNPRVIKKGTINYEVEKIIQSEIPEIKRISSGRIYEIDEMADILKSGNLFEDIVYCEASHIVEMTKERYLNIWKSVNDVRVQAGEERFARILLKIEQLLMQEQNLFIEYKTRSWTGRKKE